MPRRNKQKNQIMNAIQHFPNISSTSKEHKKYEQLFSEKALPKFNLQPLKQSDPNLLTNDKFLTLLSELEHWNHTLQDSSQPICNRRSQLKRNQQIHSSLMRIVLLPKENYPPQLQKVYKWYLQNSLKEDNNFGIHASQLQNCTFFKKRKITQEDQENQIRNTYKTNLPYELHQYRRRNFGDIISKPIISKSNNKQNKKSSKLLFEDRTHYAELMKLMENQDRMLLYNEQKRMRMRREMQEIQAIKIKWNFERGKFQEQTAKNFYNGKFKNIVMKNIDKKTNNVQSAYTTFTNSFSSLQNQTSYLFKNQISTALPTQDDNLSTTYHQKGSTSGIDGITLINNNNNVEKVKRKKPNGLDSILS